MLLAIKLPWNKATLEGMLARPPFLAVTIYPPDNPRYRLDRRAKFFWDVCSPRYGHNYFHDKRIGRAVYFTSSTGDDDEMHEVRKLIRKHGFEPQVIWEPKQLAEQRARLLNQHGIIERAKGVDIGIAVRMLEDAYSNTFDDCLLFTSDVDYMPVIRAVRRMGKRVLVLGYREGLTKRSALEFEPDAFYDLGEIVRAEYCPKPS
jgi:uncharacterized LabA/DUF88 family protein